MRKIEEIVKKMAGAVNVSAGEIIGRSRRQPVAAARQCVCYIAFNSGYTCKEIGGVINRDRVTVYHSVLLTKERLNARDLLTKRIMEEYMDAVGLRTLEGGEGKGVRK